MPNQICIHCYVSGRVQGVWFRASTKEEADRLGVTGWVRNMTDGRVEAFICGENDKVMALYEWLKKGPEQAQVEDVTFKKEELKQFSNFEVVA